MAHSIKSEVQLKSREIKEFREELLQQQGNICPLCEEEICEGEATLDHCYDTGRVRAVLHRSCNGAEGQIKKWAGQRSKGDNPSLFIKNLLLYWDTDWRTNPFHPKHGKPITKRRRKRNGKRVKRNSNTKR